MHKCFPIDDITLKACDQYFHSIKPLKLDEKWAPKANKSNKRALLGFFTM